MQVSKSGRLTRGTETRKQKPPGWGRWGPRQTCERVSPFVAEAADGGQHVLLGAEGAEIPLSLGVSAVLSQACSGGRAGEQRPHAQPRQDAREAPVFHTERSPERAPRSQLSHLPLWGPPPCLAIPHAPVGMPLPGLAGSACQLRVRPTGGALLFPQEALGLCPDFRFLRAGRPLHAGRTCGDTRGGAGPQGRQGAGTHRLGLYPARCQRAR